jgi:hypothetical protein
MQKDIKKWFSRLTRTGKILLYAAGVALIWLLLGLINNIFDIIDVNLGVVGIILNVVAILLIVFVILQAAAVIYMMREENERYREMMTKGRRRGNSIEQAAGHRTQASLTRRGAQSAQMHVRGVLTVENINQKYPAKWYKRPSIVSEWKDITEPGLYALNNSDKTKIEIIDASEVGGGFFVGTWEGNRFFKYKRTLILNKRTGRPQSYSSLRNAKKALKS